jgi:hypothetical protein
MKVAAQLCLALCVTTLVSCGGGGAPAADTAFPDTSQLDQANDTLQRPSDLEAIARIYDPNYSVPDDFFVDERAGTAQSYTAHHVMDDSLSYELCTDDFATAEQWEADDNNSRSVSGYYVGAYENDRYFEFIRELSYDSDVGNIADVTSPGFARVFKCNSTSRIGVDRSALSGYAGKLNARPLDGGSIRIFSEYLWQFAFFPARYKKVLGSYQGQDDGSVSQTLLIGFASTQGSGQCDRIDLAEWRFSADLGSGEVTSDFDIVHSFNAELAEGSPRLCD